MMINKIFFLLSLYTAAALAGLSSHDRPSELKDAIEGTARSVAQKGAKKGLKAPYDLTGLEEHRLLWETIKQEFYYEGRSQFCIIDVGGGAGGWSQYIVRWINQLMEQDPEAPGREVKINFLSLTGENRGKAPDVIEKGVCTVQVVWGVNLENLYKEFDTHPYKEILQQAWGQADFLVSNLTFLYFHDPLGTLCQVYELLKPEGILMIDSFPKFIGDRAGASTSFRERHQNMHHLVRTLQRTRKVRVLLRETEDPLHCSLIMRKETHHPLELPFTYGPVIAYPQPEARPKLTPHLLWEAEQEPPFFSSLGFPEGYLEGDAILFSLLRPYFSPFAQVPPGFVAISQDGQISSIEEINL